MLEKLFFTTQFFPNLKTTFKEFNKYLEQLHKRYNSSFKYQISLNTTGSSARLALIRSIISEKQQQLQQTDGVLRNCDDVLRLFETLLFPSIMPKRV